MKATGIVRRIDDLGRVVIPKEIRRTMRIREGDPLDTTLTPFNRFCIAIHSVVERYKKAEWNHSALMFFLWNSMMHLLYTYPTINTRQNSIGRSTMYHTKSLGLTICKNFRQTTEKSYTINKWVRYIGKLFAPNFKMVRMIQLEPLLIVL